MIWDTIDAHEYNKIYLAYFHVTIHVCLKHYVYVDGRVIHGL